MHDIYESEVMLASAAHGRCDVIDDETIGYETTVAHHSVWVFYAWLVCITTLEKKFTDAPISETTKRHKKWDMANTAMCNCMESGRPASDGVNIQQNETQDVQADRMSDRGTFPCGSPPQQENAYTKRL